MTIDEAIAVLQKMDWESELPFSEEQKRAIVTLGAAGWAADIVAEDTRLDGIPSLVRELIQIAATKRVKH